MTSDRREVMADVKQLKLDRGHKKGNLTKKCGKICELMTDFDNVKIVKNEVEELNNIICAFRLAHDTYHALLSDKNDIEESQYYYDLVQAELNAIQGKIAEYIQGAVIVQHEATRSAAKQSAKQSAVKRELQDNASLASTSTSSIAGARVRATARKAALMIEAESLQDQKKLEQQELNIQQQKRELHVKTELAKADAEEKALSDAVSETHRSNIPAMESKENILRWKEEVDRLTAPYEPHTLSAHATPFQPASYNDNVQLLDLIKQGQQQQDNLLNIVQLPRAELMTFDGNPLKYFLFIRSFENSVESGTSDANARLTRLLQYCTGKAKKVIECCSVMDPVIGYMKAKKLLKERFGNDYVIAESWINKVTEGQRIKSSDRDGLQEFADDLVSCKETLTAMGKLHEIKSQKSLVKIIEKLPLYLINRWKKQAHTIWKKYDRVSLDNVVDFVCDAAEEANDPVFGKLADKDRETQKSKSSKKPAKQEHTRYNFSTAAQADSAVSNDQHQSSKSLSDTIHGDTRLQVHAVNDARKPIRCCIMCAANDHNLFGCNEFKKLTPGDRFKFAFQKQLCNNCLIPGHYASRCMRDTTCTVPGCGRKHATLLHLPTRPREQQSQSSYNISSSAIKQSSTNEKSTGENVITSSTTCIATGASLPQSKCALPIVPVLVSGSGGHCVETYALLDNGSTNSFCSTDLIKELELNHIMKTNISLTTLSAENSETETAVVNLQVSDVNKSNTVELPRVFARSTLPINLNNVAQPDEMKKWSHFNDIQLPVINAKKVTLLIGQDVPAALIPLEVRRGQLSEPYATRTLLGWTINGPLDMLNNHKAVVNFIHADYRLENQVENFWKLEASEKLHDEKTAMSTNDKEVIRIWNNSMHKSEGHYEMAIPLKIRPPDLPNNRVVAENRLSLLGKRLRRDPELHQKYVTGMNDLLHKGYATKIPDAEICRDDGAVWYLPHHPVFHDKKPDKVRLVFDCAAKFQGSSLNDHVLKGPDLMNSLISVLIRFRQHPVAMMADVEGMFHQVKVQPTDQDLLRFLWWPNGDTNQDPEEYRMTVHIFGGVWSPSCANFTLQRTATDNQASFDHETVETVMNSFYVDDCLKSVESEKQAIRLSAELRHLLSEGGFRLTKWISNSRNVLKSIPEAERAKDVKDLDQIQGSLPIERALGVCWDVEEDKFKFKTLIKLKPSTKRGILSIVSSVYDPLGFVSPFILLAKLILQQLCRLRVGWDDPLPESILTQWRRWMMDLPKIEQFRIDRCLKPYASCISIQLHHFSDASQVGYGVVTYLRLLSSDDQVHCSFVMSKSRLAPVKTVTIPRLELAAAALAVKVDKMIHESLDICTEESVFWTDSMIVLQCILNRDKRFNTFVANRIQSIHGGSSPQQWHHISSEINPADDTSRGLTADQIVQKKSWKNGPDFLWKPTCDWPRQPITKAQDNLIPEEEVKKEAQIYTAMVEFEDIMERLFNRRSSWYALKKTVAWILRLKNNLRNRAGHHVTAVQGNLSVTEISAAELAIVKHIQSVHFEEEIKTLKPRDGQLKLPCVKISSPLIGLEPVLSSEGILCIGGRLTHAPISQQAKHQMILPKSHHVVKLIVQHYHQESGHSGKEHVLAQIRQRYWPVRGKTVVRQVLKNCYDCRRRTASPGMQRMADLPIDRITPDKPPFSYVGLDFFGPFIVRRGRSDVKRYGCIFTCLVVRAIHIEISYTMDTTSCINAIQRFICRRGVPIHIRSDNGTNIIGANRELREAIDDWNQNKIEEFLKQKEITWKFNPPSASHMGGAWERQIRTIRKVLTAVLNKQTLDDESLMTFMCLVESIINSRPLTAVSDDIRDSEPLTPNHLLLLRAGPTLPPGLFVRDDLYSRRRWRHVQYLANLFWRRWTKEYLPLLQQRQKWLHPHRNLKEGDTVLVVDANTPRSLWPIARVTSAYPGTDGRVRTAEVKTRSSTLLRPINKLCLLEEAAENL